MCATHEQANPPAWPSHTAAANIQGFRFLASLEPFLRSAGTGCVYCLGCTQDRAKGHWPSRSGLPAQAHLKACTAGLENLTTRYTQLTGFLTWAVQPQVLPAAGAASCQPHVAAGAAETGPASRTEAQVMAAAAAEDSHITAKAIFKRR